MQRREKTEPAKHYYEQGIETYEKLLESDPGNLDREIGIADSLNYIGELYKYPEPETARGYFEKALAINEKAVKQFPESTSYREELIYTLKNLASHIPGKISMKVQSSCMNASLKSAGKWHWKIRENYEYEKALGVSYSELGLLLEKAEKPELAKQQYSKAGEVFRNILQNEEDRPSHQTDAGHRTQDEDGTLYPYKEALHCKRIPGTYP